MCCAGERNLHVPEGLSQARVNCLGSGREKEEASLQAQAGV